MKITVVQKNEDGSVDFNAHIDEEELAFLVNFAIESLMSIGAVAVDENSSEEQEVALPNQPVDVTLN